MISITGTIQNVASEENLVNDLFRGKIEENNKQNKNFLSKKPIYLYIRVSSMIFTLTVIVCITYLLK